jgi:hypothetical protein
VNNKRSGRIQRAKTLRVRRADTTPRSVIYISNKKPKGQKGKPLQSYHIRLDAIQAGTWGRTEYDVITKVLRAERNASAK